MIAAEAFTSSLSKCSLSTYSVPGKIARCWDTPGEKTKSPPHRAGILQQKTERVQGKI